MMGQGFGDAIGRSFVGALVITFVLGGIFCFAMLATIRFIANHLVIHWK